MNRRMVLLTKQKKLGENMKENKHIELKVLKVSQPIGEFFIASIDASDLVEISYSDVRGMEGGDDRREIERYLGIQRPLLKQRTREIRDYILNSRDATFPTSVILAIDEKCAEYDDSTSTLYIYAYEPEDNGLDSIPFNKIAKILDGQHRIAGFFDGDGTNRQFEFDKPFKLNVSIFVGIDLPEQAKIFATVNLAQTKVNKSLVYDLEDLAKKTNPFKAAHNVAVALDANEKSPFYKRIKRLGVATPNRNYEPLTQATFVESLVKLITDDPSRDRNDILDGKKLQGVDIRKHPFNEIFKLDLKEEDAGSLKIYEIIYNYFDAVRDKWPSAWSQSDRNGSLLSKSNAFKALMRFLRTHAYLYVVGNNIGHIPTSEEFKSVFKSIELSDEDFTNRNFLPGAAGESKFYKVLIGEIQTKELYSN